VKDQRRKRYISTVETRYVEYLLQLEAEVGRACYGFAKRKHALPKVVLIQRLELQEKVQMK
jgi:hypothetical protein